ncbi:penicillin-binding transpeptidase domain-containing protein [Metasolibacillus meyeri]|uniref:Penicillin-binding transpeptidase domain-containing protein n=1 Tax=Metasolibacillus meyeri TaxID=1071052 RepID=A0AAW9NKU5_9BACL|nr:penicillin-binding transpeptidase domain-containing protein [Metasolibacillus meyeri]MEC1179449.1 penicillin-binding transpeptidase domain-containing protein [Metasolibacillus meyeri]
MKWISLPSKKRLRIIIYAFFLYGLAVIARLVYVQIIQHEELTELAKENWDREIPFVTERGNIVDRQNEIIVTNKLAPTLYFIPKQNDNVELAAKQIAPILQADESELLEKMKKPAYLVKLAPEGKNITEEQVEAIQALEIKGLYSGVDYVRQYPYGSLLSRFLGFTGYDNQGLAGVEYEYNQILTGENAAIRLFTDAKNIEMAHVDDEWKEGVGGATVQLTIDLTIQQVMERELAQAMQRYDADQAIGIAMNPNTGEILALSSFPTYDPTNFKNVDSSIYNRNLPVFMTYEPGSTFKIITLSAALEEGVVDLENDRFYDPGYTIVEGARLRCWKREGHKDETFLEVVENSCNPGFIELGQRVGSEKLLQYIKDFGFGQKTGSNIAGEASGILFSEKAFGPVEHATTSFGQGISVTPIQQMQAVAAAINGGTLYTPHVVSRIVADDGEVILEHEPEAKRQVISEQTSAQVRHALESVVAKGSGKQAFREGLRIGGKTGTAQKVENGRYKEGDYIVSFIGFAPADNPEIIVYVAIDNPKSHLQFGGVIAAPIVGQIIEDVAPIVGIEKSDEQIEKVTVWTDPIMVEVADFIGKTVDEVVQQHYPLTIEWHGEGTIISEQMPSAGSKLEQQGTLHLYLTEEKHEH